jgi:hypothetical protein
VILRLPTLRITADYRGQLSKLARRLSYYYTVNAQLTGATADSLTAVADQPFDSDTFVSWLADHPAESCRQVAAAWLPANLVAIKQTGRHGQTSYAAGGIASIRPAPRDGPAQEQSDRNNPATSPGPVSSPSR